MYNNLIKTAGKWGVTSFLFGVTITAFMFGINFSLHTYAYVLDTIPTNQLTELKLDFNSVSNINNITAPLNNLISGTVNSFKQNLITGVGVSPSPIKSPSQNTDFSKFFSSSKISSADITSFLREATITGINLTILVISITTQVLKGLLSVFK